MQNFHSVLIEKVQKLCKMYIEFWKFHKPRKGYELTHLFSIQH